MAKRKRFVRRGWACVYPDGSWGASNREMWSNDFYVEIREILPPCKHDDYVEICTPRRGLRVCHDCGWHQVGGPYRETARRTWSRWIKPRRA